MPEIYTTGQFRDLVRMQYRNLAADAFAMTNLYLARGDGVAVYQNRDLGHEDVGDIQLLSYGSDSSQITAAEPPERMPDMRGGIIGSRYVLIGTYKGEPVT